jgi:hypothetical protein
MLRSNLFICREHEEKIEDHRSLDARTFVDGEVARRDCSSAETEFSASLFTDCALSAVGAPQPRTHRTVGCSHGFTRQAVIQRTRTQTSHKGRSETDAAQ